MSKKLTNKVKASIRSAAEYRNERTNRRGNKTRSTWFWGDAENGIIYSGIAINGVPILKPSLVNVSEQMPDALYRVRLAILDENAIKYQREDSCHHSDSDLSESDFFDSANLDLQVADD